VHIAFMVLFLVCSILLIMLILIQKGRGAGLAGAFGGAGGHSAFGTKTADVLTKITAGLAAAFFLLAIVTAAYLKYSGGKASAGPPEIPAPAPAPAPASQPAPAAPAGGAVPTEKSGG